MRLDFVVEDRPQCQILAYKARHRLFRKPIIEPETATRIKPTLIITATFSEEERHWINTLGLGEKTVVPGYAYNPFLWGPVAMWRDNLHDINVLKQTIIERFEYLRQVIDSHAADSPSSIEF